jgi:hypothetical protein
VVTIYVTVVQVHGMKMVNAYSANMTIKTKGGIMKLTIEIRMDNDAFHPDPNDEVIRILDELKGTVQRNELSEGLLVYSIQDINGNSVGQARVIDSERDIPISILCPNCQSEIRTNKREGTDMEITCNTCFETMFV